MAIHDTETCLAKFKTVDDVLPGFNPESIPSRRRFLNRRVKLLRNLLIWRKYCKDRLPIDILVGKLVDICIVEVAQSGWTVGGEDVVHQVGHYVSVLPRTIIFTPYSVGFQVTTQRYDTVFSEDNSRSFLNFIMYIALDFFLLFLFF